MSTTIYHTATSIDGYIADEHNSLDWLLSQPRSEPDRFAAFFAGVGAMAMGATTYEWVLEHEKLVERPEAWHGYYGDTPAWVFTHRELPVVPGVDLTFVRDDVAAVHAAMVTAAGAQDIWIVGGGDLAAQFADLGLLDRISISVAPVMLGAGAPLFPRRLTERLRLVSAEPDETFVHVTYEIEMPAEEEAAI